MMNVGELKVVMVEEVVENSWLGWLWKVSYGGAGGDSAKPMFKHNRTPQKSSDKSIGDVNINIMCIPIISIKVRFFIVILEFFILSILFCTTNAWV